MCLGMKGIALPHCIPLMGLRGVLPLNISICYSKLHEKSLPGSDHRSTLSSVLVHTVASQVHRGILMHKAWRQFATPCLLPISGTVRYVASVYAGSILTFMAHKSPAVLFILHIFLFLFCIFISCSYLTRSYRRLFSPAASCFMPLATRCSQRQHTRQQLPIAPWYAIWQICLRRSLSTAPFTYGNHLLILQRSRGAIPFPPSMSGVC